MPRQLIAVAVAAVCACARPTSTRVETVRTIVERPTICQLSPLPIPAMVIGFPIGAPRDVTLAVTKADADELRRELDGLREWAVAVAMCLGPR